MSFAGKDDPMSMALITHLDPEEGRRLAKAFRAYEVDIYAIQAGRVLFLGGLAMAVIGALGLDTLSLIIWELALVSYLGFILIHIFTVAVEKQIDILQALTNIATDRGGHPRFDIRKRKGEKEVADEYGV